MRKRSAGVFDDQLQIVRFIQYMIDYHHQIIVDFWEYDHYKKQEEEE